MPTILVLDDDQVICDVLETVLADAGYDTVVAPDAAAIPPDTRADLVITDLVPVKVYAREPALDWVAWVRERFAGAPVVILTAHAEAAEEPDMLGADALLVKPFDLDALLGKLAELLA